MTVYGSEAVIVHRPALKASLASFPTAIFVSQSSLTEICFSSAIAPGDSSRPLRAADLDYAKDS